MKFPHSRLVMAMAAGALIAVPASNSRLTRTLGPRGADPQAPYSTHDKEFYLTKDELTWVRPGFHITVNSISIPADLRPLADLSFTDDFEQPLDRNGQVTPGSLSVSLILAWWDPGARHYTSYTTRVQMSTITGNSATQASSDSGGTWTDLEVGHSTYKFKTVLPADFKMANTTTLAIYATRNTADIVGKNYYANVEHDFRPDGQAVTDTWDKIDNGACNTCHNPLSAHGGSRQDVKLCATCHQPQTSDPDTGNTVDMKVMAHKIHMGANLPSVQAGTPYVIIGFNNTPVDFSDVVFPQDIRNCATCHAPPATQAPNWYTFPGMAACASCHDDVSFAPGGNHPGGPQADDSACATCHQPQGGEFDASVIGAHTVPEKSTQLKGLNAAIVSVSNTAPGQNPTIVFNITQNDGSSVPPSSFTTQNSDGTTSSGLNVIMSGPTTDYAIPPQIRERADGATASGPNFSYTFATAIPPDAKGTWGFSIEARRTVTLNPAPSDSNTVREAAFNPVHYAAVTDSSANPRRVVVDIAKCNTCHDKLSFHGSNRLNPQECVFCHNPNMLDDQTPAESLDFKRLIHKLHRGTDLTQVYLDFNTLRFPGDLRDCQTCHTTYADGTGTEQLPDTAPPGRLATQTPRDWYTPQQPMATACLACHDTQAAAAHAFTMTAPFGEACATCHGPDAQFSVDRVHAR